MSEAVLGAQLYTCRDFCKTIEGVAETFRKVREIGYTAVQVSAFGPVDHNEVAKLADDNGLTIAATHISWRALLDDTNAVIEQHQLWECKHPAIGGLPGEYRGEDGLKKFLDELPPIAEKLAAAGMDFSYHNHNHELVRVGDKTWLELLYAQADPKHLKAEIDTYWITAGGGDPAAWVRKMAGREPLLHLKDMTIAIEDDKRVQRFAEIGEGNLNWPAILEAAKEGGVEWYLIEQDQCYGRTPFESLDISFRNLSAMGLK